LGMIDSSLAGILASGSLTLKAEVSGGQIIYIGSTIPGCATSASRWQIRKITYDGSGNITDVKFADSSNKFNKVWDSRATYTYA